MGPKSINLFHFTPKLDFLKSILEHQFSPRYCKESVEFLKLSNGNEIAFPMACFCDIPLSRIFDHTKWYGKYGLGLTKEWGIKKKLNPIFYSADDSPIVEFSRTLLNADLSPNNATHDNIVKQYLNLFPLIKPMKGMQFNKETQELEMKDFTQESEWRYVPKPYDVFFPNNDSEIVNKNKTVNFEKLTFTPEDVKYIFVQNDNEIPIIFDHIQDIFKNESDINRTMLTTRIISLETLAKDL